MRRLLAFAVLVALAAAWLALDPLDHSEEFEPRGETQDAPDPQRVDARLAAPHENSRPDPSAGSRAVVPVPDDSAKAPAVPASLLVRSSHGMRLPHVEVRGADGEWVRHEGGGRELRVPRTARVVRGPGHPELEVPDGAQVLELRPGAAVTLLAEDIRSRVDRVRFDSIYIHCDFADEVVGASLHWDFTAADRMVWAIDVERFRATESTLCCNLLLTIDGAYPLELQHDLVAGLDEVFRLPPPLEPVPLAPLEVGLSPPASGDVALELWTELDRHEALEHFTEAWGKAILCRPQVDEGRTLAAGTEETSWNPVPLGARYGLSALSSSGASARRYFVHAGAPVELSLQEGFTVTAEVRTESGAEAPRWVDLHWGFTTDPIPVGRFERVPASELLWQDQELGRALDVDGRFSLTVPTQVPQPDFAPYPPPPFLRLRVVAPGFEDAQHFLTRPTSGREVSLVVTLVPREEGVVVIDPGELELADDLAWRRVVLGDGFMYELGGSRRLSDGRVQLSLLREEEGYRSWRHWDEVRYVETPGLPTQRLVLILYDDRSVGFSAEGDGVLRPEPLVSRSVTVHREAMTPEVQRVSLAWHWHGLHVPTLGTAVSPDDPSDFQRDCEAPADAVLHWRPETEEEHGEWRSATRIDLADGSVAFSVP